MTLGEAKNKVYMLLDEHSAGGEIEHDEDIEKKMTAFFDMAQKTLAQIRKVRGMDGEKAEGLPVCRNGTISTFTNITYGCNNFCSYCIVPYVKEHERSRNNTNIVKQVKFFFI